MLARKQILLPLLLLTLARTMGADPMAHLRTTTTEEHRITHWTSEQGLPQNTVTSLLQSRDGYLWIGTRYGLARYDGVQFTDYSAQLSELGSEELDVRGLAEDTAGRLWLVTPRGLVCFDQGRFQGYTFTNAPFHGGLRQIAAHPQGGLWVARDFGVFHFLDGRTSEGFGAGRELANHEPAGAYEITALVADPAGSLWVRASAGAYFGVWQRIDSSTGRVTSITNLLDQPSMRFGGMSPEPDGSLWLAKPDELLHWEGGQVSRFDARSAWGGHLIKEMRRDAQGSLWIVSEGPVQLHRFANGRFSSYGRDEGLTSPGDVRCLFPDREGNLWVGTGSGGLCRVQPRQLILPLQGAQPGMDEVYSVSPGRDGSVWMATTHGLVKHQDGQFTVFTNSHAFEGGQVKRLRLVFERASGEVLSALDFDGLLSLQGGAISLVDCIEPIISERRLITSLAEDARGTLWIASQRGLAERRETGCRLWTMADGLSDNRTFGLVCATNGSVWVGTQNGGVNEFKSGRFRAYTVRDGLLSQDAWPLRAELDGSVWVGTPVGLNRIRDGEVRSVTMRDGLFDNIAYCLLEDRRGNYWTFGNRGIWRLKKDELHAVADGRASRVHCFSYGQADGMPSAEGNGDQQPNAVALPNGELWFPMTRGVVVLDPDRLRENDVPPSVVIEQVLIDGESVFRDGGYSLPVGFQKTGRHPLLVPPGRARVVELCYTATTFIDSDKTHFRCRLSGHRSSWHEMDTRRMAVFTNLRPGDYRFEVEARNHHGYWSKKPGVFAFSLQPHFYQTWLFYLGCSGAAATSAGAWGTRRSIIRRRLHRLERDRAIEAERNRIARDLHDDLGANLTGLAVQIDIAVHQLNDPGALRQHLQTLSRSVRGLVDVMREAVWSINPRCDTLESACDYICQYAEKFLRSVGIRCRFDLPESLPPVPLTAETRHHLLLIVKEGLNNAARYAAATEVRLELRLARNNLIVAITDNGRGCAPNHLPASTPCSADASDPDFSIAMPKEAGNGLRNMRQRIELLNGTFEITSKPGLGTTVRMRVPLPGSSDC